MKRTDADHNIRNLFQTGNPLLGHRGTRIDHTWLNNVQEEIVSVVLAGNIELNGKDTMQMLQALRRLGLGYDTLSYAAHDVEAVTNPIPINTPIRIYGNNTPGDGGGFEGLVQGAPDARYPRGGRIMPVAIKYSVALWGAMGDGVTDDTAAIQQAVDFVISCGGGIVWFPAGTYLVREVDVQHGLTLQGDGGAILVRPNDQPKFSRSFTTQNRMWSESYDSPPLIIRDLHFHGNRTGQGPYNNNQKEQQHAIFACGDQSKSGRLRLIVERCVFEEGTGDAISIYNNVDAIVTNCFARNVFRGGIVLTGGWSKLRVTNCTFTGDIHPTGLDIEIDGPGYGGSLASDIEMANINLDGDFDLSLPLGGKALLTNINSSGAPFNVTGPGMIRITNSRFVVGVKSSTLNRIVWPMDTVFSHCSFVLENNSKIQNFKFACAHVYWNTHKTDYSNQNLTFNNCDFQVGSSIDCESITYGIYCEPDFHNRKNRLCVNNSNFYTNLKYGVWLTQGGTIELINNYYDCITAMRFSYAGNYYFNCLIDGGRFGSNCKFFINMNNSHIRNKVYFQNLTIKEINNNIVTSANINLNYYSGSRTIISNTNPSISRNGGGFIGDIWQLDTPRSGKTWQWVCIASHHTSAAWRPLAKVGDAQ